MRTCCRSCAPDAIRSWFLASSMVRRQKSSKSSGSDISGRYSRSADRLRSKSGTASEPRGLGRLVCRAPNATPSPPGLWLKPFNFDRAALRSADDQPNDHRRTSVPVSSITSRQRTDDALVVVRTVGQSRRDRPRNSWSWPVLDSAGWRSPMSIHSARTARRCSHPSSWTISATPRTRPTTRTPLRPHAGLRVVVRRAAHHRRVRRTQAALGATRDQPRCRTDPGCRFVARGRVGRCVSGVRIAPGTA